MATVSSSRQRTIQVIDLSTLTLSQDCIANPEDDLPTLFENLRYSLSKKSGNNDEIDENIFAFVQIISNKIEAIGNMNSSTQALDILHEIFKRYISELLSLNNCAKILSNSTFQKIFLSIISTEQIYDIKSIYANDGSYARMVCDRSFELLSLSAMIDFLNGKATNELISHLSNVLRSVTFRIQLTIESIVFEKDILQSQIPTVYSLIVYVDRHIESTHFDESLTIDYIMNFLWALVNTINLVPTMIQAECHKYVLKWISVDSTLLSVQRGCIHIIHSLAGHDQGSEEINRANGIHALQKFKERILNENKNKDSALYTEIHLVYCMTLALLTEPKQNQDAWNNIRKVLDQIMQLAIDCGQCANNKCQGFHISEPIKVLAKLCMQDEILNYVLKESAVCNMKAKSRLNFFCELIIKFRGALVNTDSLDKLTLMALFNILWSVSFHNGFVQELKSNSKFLITVKSLANDSGEDWVDKYVPKHMSLIPKAARGILWNLNEKNPVRSNKSEIIQKQILRNECNKNLSNQTRVMISYSHADIEFCHQLVESLQKDNSLHIWVDFAYCHTDDTWEEVAGAIEKASAVLFLMSNDYQQSKSCRQEVMYTKDSLKKRFIPIYVQKDFVATGWLGVRIVGSQYIRFGKKSFDDTVKDLIKIIMENKNQRESDATKLVTPSVPVENTHSNNRHLENGNVKYVEKYLSKPTEQWTKQDISQWFYDNSIPRELEELYDFQYGLDLLLYGQCLRPDWQLEYDLISARYEQRYKMKIYRDEFVHFVGAIYRLKPLNSKLCILS